MAGGSLIDGSVQLREALDMLERTWHDSQAGWDDEVRNRFEAERLLPLRKQVLMTLDAMQKMSEVLKTAVRQSSEPDRHA